MLQVYAKIFERDNMRLLLKPVVMGETRDFASSNVDSFVKRGLRLAPNVDLTPLQERKEDVDRGIVEAVQQLPPQTRAHAPHLDHITLQSLPEMLRRDHERSQSVAHRRSARNHRGRTRSSARRGRNAHVKSVPGHATRAQYGEATALEALLGWLYLKGRRQRLQELFRVMMEE